MSAGANPHPLRASQQVLHHPFVAFFHGLHGNPG